MSEEKEYTPLGDSIENDDLSIIQKIFIELERNDTWWKKFKREFKFKLEILAYHILPKDFELYWGLFWLQYYGYRPVLCIPNYYGEYTYIFRTPEEAKKAFDHLETGRWGSKLPSVVGWFYGIEDFKKYIKEDDYDWKKEFDYQNLIWVDHKFKEGFYE